MATGRLPAIVFAIAFHEAAHAWMALRCGDDTASRMGRITLNPVAHFDPIGFLAILFFPIGWGRPVPYVERNLRNPRWDAMKIAAAGPASNVVLALVFGILYRLTGSLISLDGMSDNIMVFRGIAYLHFVLAWSVYINIALCLFNLIPVFPLDGEKILVGLLPYQQAVTYESLRQYGPMMLLVLIFAGQGLIMAWIELMGSPMAWVCAGNRLGEIWHVILVMFDFLFKTPW